MKTLELTHIEIKEPTRMDLELAEIKNNVRHSGSKLGVRYELVYSLI